MHGPDRRSTRTWANEKVLCLALVYKNVFFSLMFLSNSNAYSRLIDFVEFARPNDSRHNTHDIADIDIYCCWCCCWCWCEAPYSAICIANTTLECVFIWPVLGSCLTIFSIYANSVWFREFFCIDGYCQCQSYFYVYTLLFCTFRIIFFKFDCSLQCALFSVLLFCFSIGFLLAAPYELNVHLQTNLLVWKCGSSRIAQSKTVFTS